MLHEAYLTGNNQKGSADSVPAAAEQPAANETRRSFSQTTIEFWKQTGQLARRSDLRAAVEEQTGQIFTPEE